MVPSHNVTTELKDIDYIRNDAQRARREFGYLRMWSIHPNQIVPILEAMRPDFSEVQAAAEILIAAQDKDWGPIQHAGKLHDRASYRYYWELLERAHVTGMDILAQQRAVSLPEELPILYRDEHIVVIDKPPGLLVHRSEIDRHETRFAIPDPARPDRPAGMAGAPSGPGTSGILLFALNSTTASRLGQQLKKGKCRQALLGDCPWFSGGLRQYRPSALRQRDAYEFQGEASSSEAQEALTRFSQTGRNRITACRRSLSKQPLRAAGGRAGYRPAPPDPPSPEAHFPPDHR